jgi:hypothetical protein
LSVAEGIRENAEKNESYEEFKKLAAEKRLAEIEARIPDCPQCDMGEADSCICSHPLISKVWFDEVVAERDRYKKALEWAMNEISDGVDEGEAPEHFCGYAQTDTGHCDYHEKYFEAMELLHLAPPAQEAGKGK